MNWLKIAAGRGPVVIVAAHPDDETLGAGGHFPDWLPHIVHMTDGAPRSRPDRECYASVRRDELSRAYDASGIAIYSETQFGVADQEIFKQLAELTLRLKDYLLATGPALVLTHPYEGGHPDHDSTAFIVQSAVQLAGNGITRGEFTSYHNAPPFEDARLEFGCFLSGSESEVNIRLPAERQALKERMLACFESQQDMVRQFDSSQERFRLGPAYDFTQPPHPGTLFYDTQNWGVQSHEWRRLALDASLQLGLRGVK